MNDIAEARARTEAAARGIAPPVVRIGDARVTTERTIVRMPASGSIRSTLVGFLQRKKFSARESRGFGRTGMLISPKSLRPPHGC